MASGDRRSRPHSLALATAAAFSRAAASSAATLAQPAAAKASAAAAAAAAVARRAAGAARAASATAVATAASAVARAASAAAAAAVALAAAAAAATAAPALQVRAAVPALPGRAGAVTAAARAVAALSAAVQGQGRAHGAHVQRDAPRPDAPLPAHVGRGGVGHDGERPAGVLGRAARGVDRHGQPARRFFDQVENGAICGSNWYEGNGGMLGMVGGGPRFPRHPGSDRSTPALFGFDEAIDAHCAFQLGGWDKGPGGHAERCVAANRNILSLYGDRVPYNICRNLEWQVCAARGKLPYQGGRKIVFAVAPSSLDPSGATGKPLGQCKGWVPGRKPEGGFYGYATDDIFYLEVCMMNQICKNGEHLFHMQAGEEFQRLRPGPLPRAAKPAAFAARAGQLAPAGEVHALDPLDDEGAARVWRRRPARLQHLLAAQQWAGRLPCPEGL